MTGIPHLIIDALHYREHPTHMNFYEALEVSSSLEAGNVYLTHLSHELDPREAQSELPANTRFAYDGLKLTFPVDAQH